MTYLHNIRTTETETLRCIGISKAGDVGAEKNSLHDTGSSASFITHQTAEELNFEVMEALKLTIKTVAAPIVIDTYVYRGKMYNYEKQKN